MQIMLKFNLQIWSSSAWGISSIDFHSRKAHFQFPPQRYAFWAQLGGFPWRRSIWEAGLILSIEEFYWPMLVPIKVEAAYG